jgi:phosphatidylglycerol:prolipoprotein diacylglycerol transferase
MHPDAIFSIFGLEVYLYGLMIAVGLLACFAVLYLYMKKWEVKENFVDFLFFNGVASVVVGFGVAAVFQGFYNYLDNPEGGFRLDGGITFIGGLIGGIGCFLLIYFFFRKKYTTRLYQVVSVIPCCILVAHAFGRIGCFFAGCCHGKATDGIFGVQFPGFSYAVHPTQLYEAIFLFLLFGVCSFLALKFKFQHNLTVYLIAYGIFRFFLEFLRDDHRGSFIPGITPSQFWSIVMVVAGIGLFFYQRYLVKKASIQVETEKTETDESGDTEEPNND